MSEIKNPQRLTEQYPELFGLPGLPDLRDDYLQPRSSRGINPRDWTKPEMLAPLETSLAELDSSRVVVYRIASRAAEMLYQREGMSEPHPQQTQLSRILFNIEVQYASTEIAMEMVAGMAELQWLQDHRTDGGTGPLSIEQLKQMTNSRVLASKDMILQSVQETLYDPKKAEAIIEEARRRRAELQSALADLDVWVTRECDKLAGNREFGKLQAKTLLKSCDTKIIPHMREQLAKSEEQFVKLEEYVREQLKLGDHTKAPVQDGSKPYHLLLHQGAGLYDRLRNDGNEVGNTILQEYEDRLGGFPQLPDDPHQPLRKLASAMASLSANTYLFERLSTYEVEHARAERKKKSASSSDQIEDQETKYRNIMVPPAASVRRAFETAQLQFTALVDMLQQDDHVSPRQIDEALSDLFRASDDIDQMAAELTGTSIKLADKKDYLPADETARANDHQTREFMLGPLFSTTQHCVHEMQSAINIMLRDLKPRIEEEESTVEGRIEKRWGKRAVPEQPGELARRRAIDSGGVHDLFAGRGPNSTKPGKTDRPR